MRKTNKNMKKSAKTRIQKKANEKSFAFCIKNKDSASSST